MTAVALAEARAGSPKYSKEAFAEAVIAASELPSTREDLGTPRDSNLKNIARSEASAGFREDALKTVNLLPDEDRPDALADVGSACAEAGDIKHAEQIAAQVAQPEKKGVILSAIISATIRLGKFKMGEDSLGRNKAIAECGSPCLPLFETLAAAGQIKEAQTIAKAIKWPGIKVEAIGAIAKEQAKAGDTTVAFQTVTSASEGDFNENNQKDYRDELLLHIVEGQSESGDTRRAHETAESIHDVFWKSIALSEIARAEVRAGNVDNAVKTASSIHDKNYRCDAYEPIARAKVKAHDLQGAFKLAESFGAEPVGWNARILVAIAETQGEMGDLTGAHETASKIRDDCVDALGPVAAAQVKAGDAKGAIAWVLAGGTPNTAILGGVIEGAKDILKKNPGSREILEFKFFELSEEKGCY